MNKKALAGLLGLGIVLFILGIMHEPEKYQKFMPDKGLLQNVTEEKKDTSQKEKENKEEKVKPVPKSQAAKQAVVDADLYTMSSLGLYYDYANLSLVEVVEAYMAEYGIDPSQVAFSYHNPSTGEHFSYNDTEPMTAGSTYKLPLNMKIVDEVEKGRFSMEEGYDITQISYEYEGEYLAYRAQFGDVMTIPDMQEYSIKYSENTPAHAMVAMLGGDWQKIYDSFDTYGKSKGDLKTIDVNIGNKTTTDFYIQVMRHLYKHQEKYADIIHWMDASFPGLYYEGLQPHLWVIQKPGYVNEALNVDAIVMEETPYLIALYTRYLGGSTDYTETVNGLGYYQLTQIAYVINEWHRVHMNPTPADFDEKAYLVSQQETSESEITESVGESTMSQEVTTEQE